MAGSQAGLPPARRALPLLLAALLSACLLATYGIVQNYTAAAARHHAAQSSAAVGSAAAAGGHGSHAAAAHQHSQLLQELLQQVAALNRTMPALVKQALHEQHQAALTAVKQQQTPPPAAAPQQQQQQAAVEVQPADDQVHHVAKARAACDKQGGAGISLKVTDQLVAPVVIVAHNRVHYLARCLMTVLRYWSEDESNAARFPLFVSVDGGHGPTMAFAGALHFGASVQVIRNLRDPGRCKPNDGYCNLAVHYHMLLELFTDCLNAPRVLFLEEDLEVSPDFFPYFASLAPLLSSDDSLLCVSAWNDHGQAGRASNATALYRTDIFPGLGWMTTAAIAKELHPKWPDVYWDDWLREPAQRRGRQCIYPEVPRTHTFGKAGTSGGQFFDAHLAPMLLNKQPVDWAHADVSYLRRDAYAGLMASALEAAEPLPAATAGEFCRVEGQQQQQQADAAGSSSSSGRDLVLRYKSPEEYQQLAQQLAPMLSDVKGGNLPRGSYNGVVVVRCRGRRLFIAPMQKPQASAAAAAAAAQPAHGKQEAAAPRDEQSQGQQEQQDDKRRRQQQLQQHQRKRTRVAVAEAAATAPE